MALVFDDVAVIVKPDGKTKEQKEGGEMSMPNLEPIKNWTHRVGQNKPPPDLIQKVLADTSEVSAIVGRSEIGKTNFSSQVAHC